MAGERWATFDCYGTLIDWEEGIGVALQDLWPGDVTAEPERLATMLDRFHAIEPEVQAETPTAPYRVVLAETVRRLAADRNLPLHPSREYAVVDSLPGWPPFPEAPACLAALRDRGWRLAVLSNTDPDLLAASVSSLGVPFDLTVTAAEAGSYKPAHGHWDRFFERTGTDRGRHVHVGASLFHDVEPCAEMGLRCVWVNRRSEVTNLPRDAELADLGELPETLERLVPMEA